MDMTMPASIGDLFAQKLHKKSLTKVNVAAEKKPKRKAKKSQARKNKSAQIQEFVWLKKILSWKTFFSLFIFSTVLISPFYLSENDIMPIEKIRIKSGFNQLDTARIKTRLEHYLGQGFFSVDIQSMQQEINQQPWIKSVSIQRVWPGELNVIISEKIAFARWDENHLLSADGVIFKADTQAFQDLPLINGLRANSVDLLQRYQQLQQRFSALGLTLGEMKQDRKGALFLRLNQHLQVKLGSDQIDRKINQLLAVFPAVLKPVIETIETIDFRYSNGFAIDWKDDKQPLQEKQLKRGRKHV